MKPEFAPSPILFAALKVLFLAACKTRNWTCGDAINQKQINDLWEALHEVPDLLTRWRGEESEKELMLYLQEYAAKWSDPALLEYYRAHLEG